MEGKQTLKTIWKVAEESNQASSVILAYLEKLGHQVDTAEVQKIVDAARDAGKVDYLITTKD